MTAQLRKLSEQQQQLVTLVDTCFRGLDDRLMAVEAAVGGIHAHLGFAQRDVLTVIMHSSFYIPQTAVPPPC